MIKNYFKIAIRQLFKNKLFSFLNIFGFAISLAVCLLLITILNDQYSYDDFHENGDEIFRVTSSKREKTIPIQNLDAATTSLTIAEELASDYPFVKKAVRIAGMDGDFIYRDKNLGSPKGYAVDQSFLEMFSFGWTAGNKTTALKDPRSIILTEETAKKYFPNQEPIGEFVEINPLGKFQIKGILPTPPIRSHIRFDFLISYATVTAMTEIERQQIQIGGYENIWRGLVYLLLDEKSSQSQLDNALSQIAKTYSTRDENYNYLFKSQALSLIMPTTNLGNDIGLGLPKIGIYFLIVLGIIIMLAACFNYMNLSVAKSIKRAKEIGIRKVAGAERKDIIIQFLGEAVLISFLSFLVAIILLEFMIPVFYSLDPFVEDVFHLSRSPKLYLIFLGFSLFIGLLAGIFPAFNISRYQPIQSIQKLSNVKVFSHIGLRKMLITFQFTLSLIFILTVIIVMQQQRKVLNADLGLRIDNLMNVSIDNGIDYEVFAHKVKQLKGVESVSASRDAILMGGELVKWLLLMGRQIL